MGLTAFRPAVWLAWCLLPSPVGLAQTTNDVVQLPPYVVEHEGTGVRWRYGRSPEFDIISRASDTTTREIADRYHRLHLLLELVLPSNLQLKVDMPRLLIVCDETELSATAKRMTAAVQAADPGATRRARFVFQRDPAIFDPDCMAAFATVATSTRNDSVSLREAGSVEFTAPAAKPARLHLTPGYVSFLVSRRTPPLPSWFVSGFLSLYQQLHFSSHSITADPMTWTSADAKRELLTRRDRPVDLLPLAEFLAGKTYSAEEAAAFQLWLAQSELFVRWGLDPAHPKRREQLWKFAECLAVGSPTPDLVVRECFGFDSETLERHLIDYVRSAVEESQTWKPKGRLPGADLALRDASLAEVARIKGEWERLATSYVRARNPDLAEEFAASALRTFGRAYERGVRDPAFLASYGLCELEAGNGGRSRELLELAAQFEVVRPRVYAELARMRLEDALDRPLGHRGKINAEQTTAIVEIINAGRQHSPKLPELYEILAVAVASSEAALEEAQVVALHEGVAHFPGRFELVKQIVTLFRAKDHTDEANRALDSAARVAAPGAQRERLLELQQGSVLSDPRSLSRRVPAPFSVPPTP